MERAEPHSRRWGRTDGSDDAPTLHGEQAPSIAFGTVARGLLIAIALALVLGYLGSLPLFEPDEGRYTEIPREMLVSGEYVTPTLNGVAYLEKPPLYYWLTAVALRWLGPGEFAPRFWSAAFGLLCLVLAGWIGRDLGGERVRWAAVAALATSPLWVVLSRLSLTDMTLTFFVNATLVAFWFAHRRGAEAAAPRLWYAVFAASGLAVMTKGVIGLVLPGATIFLYLLVTGQLVAVLRRVPWFGGSVLFAAIVVPWHLLAERANPGFLEFYLVGEHLLRFTTPVARREEALWFFPLVLGSGLLPWSGLLPAGLLRDPA